MEKDGSYVDRKQSVCSVSMTNIRGIPKTGIVGSKGKQNLDFVTVCKLHLGKVWRICSSIKGKLPGYLGRFLQLASTEQA